MENYMCLQRVTMNLIKLDEYCNEKTCFDICERQMFRQAFTSLLLLFNVLTA